MERRNRDGARVLCCSWLGPATLARTLILSVFLSWAGNASSIPELSGPQGEQVDIGNAALAFALEAYPDLDTVAYSRRLDALSRRVLNQANGRTDSGCRIAALNAVFFAQEGYHYDHRPEARTDQSNYFLTGIMDSKRGTCYTMPLLYVAVAQRAGYPIYLVAAPDHLFARYVGPNKGSTNIEVTSGGKSIPDEGYVRDFSISRAGLLSGSYLRTLSHWEAVGHLWGASAVYHAAQGNLSEAIRGLKAAISRNPQLADHHQSLADLYLVLGERFAGERGRKYLRLANVEKRMATTLGFVGQEDVTRARNTRRR